MTKSIEYHIGGFPPASTIDWEAIIPLLGPANAAVARYDGLLNAIPNAAVLLSPLMTTEAVLSSRIEGTQATMGEVLEFEAQADLNSVSEEKRNDIEEILNYRKAMRHAEEMLKELPLCQRVVKEAHAVLLDGVRGHNKTPGQYRRVPNWIGPQGCSIEEARYIPIAANALPDAMKAWEIYIHKEAPDRVVQLAILHAEFEALHPFLDGNGRIGRMLIPLFMSKYGLLRWPMFYISAYFERNREEYYDRLLAVSRDEDWTGWIAFFLRSVIEQAKENQAKAQAIRELYDETIHQVAEITHSQYAIDTVEFIFRRPIFKASDFYREPEFQASRRRILNMLQKKGFFHIIQESSGRRSAVLAYKKLLNIVEGRKVF